MGNYLHSATATHPVSTRIAATSQVLPRIGEGRSVLVCAVHHVHADGITYTGGAEKHVLTAIDALLHSGARVVVAYSGSDIYENLRRHPASERLDVHRVDWTNDVFAGDRRITPACLWQRWRWLRAQHVDTAYFVQQAAGRAFRASVVAARMAGLRVVCTLRQAPEDLPPAYTNRILGILPRPQLWRRRMLRQHRLPAQCAHTLVYNTHTIADDYEQTYLFDANKRAIVSNGLPLSGEPRKNIGAMRVGYLGRLTEPKGVIQLLDAFSRIATHYPQATLTYFGDGPLRDALRRRANAAGLGQRVRLAGYVTDRSAVFDAIDLYVHPSLREALPNSVLEAMAAGVPCIATDAGGTRDVVNDGITGLLIAPDDVTALSKAIQRMIDDADLYSRCAENAAQLIEREFNPEENAARLVQAILGLPR